MQTISAEALRELTYAILAAAGTPAEPARIVADHLVDANLAGHDSHGVIRVPAYLRQVQAGQLVPAATIAVLQDRPAIALLDGAWGFGHVAMRRATELAVEKCQREGIAYVGVVRCHHIGRLGEYATLAAERGAACFVTVALPDSNIVAPHWGRRGVTGTNPVAFGYPVADGKTPFALDMATSVVAEGKVQVARAKGAELPPGYIIDKAGRPSVNPLDLYEGGALLPVGGHKGYGLSLASILFAPVLTHAMAFTDGDRTRESAAAVIAIDVEGFGPRDRSDARAQSLFDRMRAVPPIEGVESVLIPGEPEAMSRAERLRDGIPLADRTWDELKASATALGVQPPALA